MVDVTTELQPACPAAVPQILQTLRDATGPQHKALEARLPFERAELDHLLYRQLVEAYYGFHHPLEQRIVGVVHAREIYRERRKVPALLNDLQALGLSTAQIDALPQCSELPALESTAQLLGVMYVMEGATLGGQVLRRIIAGRLGIDAQSGGEFLDVYGRDTGRLWKSFLKQLADFDDPLHNAEVVASACLTFACFQDWLERAGVLNDR